MERTVAPTRAVQDDTYLCRGNFQRNAAATATEGVCRPVFRGMIAGFAPGSTALLAVKLGPT